MHLTGPGGSQSPEGQTGAETYERGGLSDRLVSFLTRSAAIRAVAPANNWH
jgi:hypothetical protein